MTFTSNGQENSAAESLEGTVESVATVHVEDAPCVVFRAVKINEAHTAGQPRTMHAWLT